MTLTSNMKHAFRSITRRKSKNISAILAITLGVTLLVGVQITTATLENNFLTSIIISEGETDFEFSNGTLGGTLSSQDLDNISSILEAGLGYEPPGIMGSLVVNKPLLIGSQYEPTAEVSGVALDYPEVFGSFYDWETGEELDINDYIADNTSCMFSSELAENMNITKDTTLPVTVATRFTEVKIQFLPNATGQIVPTPVYTDVTYEFNVTAIYDQNKPGMGAMVDSSSGRMVIRLDRLQYLESLQDVEHLLDPSGATDFVDSYLVSLRGNHFEEPATEEELSDTLEAIRDEVPQKYDVETDEMVPVYEVTSSRLSIIQTADFIFNILNTFLTALGLLIIATGLLLITNVQLMAIEDREFQTGVLRAVGEKRRGIFFMYLIEALFQGFLGGLIGLFGGIGFGWVVAFYLADLFGLETGTVIPVVNQNIVIFSVIVGVVIAIVTGILPSIRASRVNIVEALRGVKAYFEERSSRNYVYIGLVLFLVGLYILLRNGIFDSSLQGFWEILENSDGIRPGYDSIIEWENILLGTGLMITGLGTILSNRIDRTKAMNITAIVLWLLPTIAFVWGLDWIESSTGEATNLLIYSIVELVIGSVMLVGLNLKPIMSALRSVLIRLKATRGVAQISPAMISSHRLRSTLTFAIFAVVLTLNVTVATLVETNISSTIGQAGEDARGVDIYVKLSEPEIHLDDTSYAKELYKLDSRISDVIPFKTTDNSFSSIPNLVALEKPGTANFTESLLPLRYVEVAPEQIRGNASDAADSTEWRYDFYLDDFPTGVREEYDTDMNDKELLQLSKRSWDTLFNQSYQMPAYEIEDSGFGGGPSGGFGEDELTDDMIKRDENGTIIQHPIVFTDSFFLPVGTEIWVAMNTTQFGQPIYQPFTIGGALDYRAGGCPLGPSSFAMGGGDFRLFGALYIPDYWSNQTSFFSENFGQTKYSRKIDQYDAFLVKTSVAFENEAELDTIAQVIEDYTNTDGSGYRELANVTSGFITASSISLYSELKSNLELANQFTNFMQIYVNFGLIIGAVGMGVISVRNVAERKREIGMMRAIGFPRFQVMLSVLLELFVLGIIGLFIGIGNGLVVTYGFAQLQGVTIVIPWNTLTIYLSFITLVSFIAGAIPGLTASRIPPSEALRYVG